MRLESEYGETLIIYKRRIESKPSLLKRSSQDAAEIARSYQQCAGFSKFPMLLSGEPGVQ